MGSLVQFLCIYPLLSCLGHSGALRARVQSTNTLDLTTLSSPANNTLSEPSPSIALPAGFALSLDSATNLSTSALTGNGAQFTAPRAECDFQGPNPNLYSCRQAWNVFLAWLSRLPRQRITVGPRGVGFWDIDGVMTFVGSDGHCVFSIYVEDNQPDETSGTELVAAGSALISTCLAMTPSLEGEATGLGRQHQITLDVRINPDGTQAIQCMSPPPSGPPASSCENLRNFLPQGTRDQTYGQRGMAVDVTLPKYFSSHDGRCTLGLFSTGPSDIWSGWELYSAAATLEAICVRQGRRGKMSQLGVSHNLVITLSDSAQPPLVQVNASGLDLE